MKRVLVLVCCLFVILVAYLLYLYNTDQFRLMANKLNPDISEGEVI